MQHAVNTAQEILHDYQFKMIQKYFREDGTPIMQDIRLSDGRVIEAPWITLVPQSLLAVSEVEMDFTIQVTGSELKGFMEEAQGEVQKANTMAPPRSSFQVAFAPKKRSSFFGRLFGGDKDKQDDESANKESEPTDIIDVKIKFKSVDLPEGASRVLDALNIDIGEKKDK
jgi:hypothetical protein